MSSIQFQPPSMHLSHVMCKAEEHVQACFEQHVDLQGTPYRCSRSYHHTAVLLCVVLRRIKGKTSVCSENVHLHCIS